jgi:RNA polymerase sigma-70 factor (ECF subfamily)
MKSCGPAAAIRPGGRPGTILAGCSGPILALLNLEALVTADPIDLLLEQLRLGDPLAVEQLLTLYQPYLRLVVRRHLPREYRAKFDSLDVVQSVWASVLPGLEAGRWQFATAGHLRAFLVRVTQRRLCDRLRHNRLVLDCEQPLGDSGLENNLPGNQPRPSELAQADDLWQRLLALCPPAHRQVLLLKRQGLLLQEIADRTGLHEGSVRRILRKLASQIGSQGGTLSPDQEEG